jgi:receptor expression-enhancing protein 5/6
MFPFLNVILLGTQYGYPAVETAKVVRSKSQKEELVQWTTYWVLIALILVIESWLSSIFDMIPLFGELKLLILAWLIHPEFLGATYLWYAHFKAPFAQLEAFVLAHFGNFIEKMKKDEKNDKFDESSEAKQ